MHAHALVAIVTILALLLYVVMLVRVGQGRAKYGVPAPAISGHADFDRLFRVQANTLEWLPIFLPSLWLFALYWNDMDRGDLIAAGLGLVWIVGRILYMTGYTREAGARSTGFLIQLAATAALLFGALGRISWVALAGPA
jgi:uncharacterized membrane protein YecN with MAPEG domain